MTPKGALGRVLLSGAGVVAARVALRAATQTPATGELARTNFRGRTVTLAAGPALAVAASVSAAAGAGSVPAAAAALTAGLGAGAVGRYDDVVGARPEQKSAKGFRGHLAALREGRVTSGLVKIAGVGGAALAAAALLDRRDPPRGVVSTVLGAGVIAGTANLVNLLDLRPGRALKAGLIIGAPLLPGTGGGLVAGPLGAAAGLLPDDLDEQVMLGDSGANALGALLGVGLAARCGPWGRAGLLVGLAALTAASEKVSFTKVIEATPGLRELDALGRRRPE
jgi:UDP-N-acetylmuramyl pentapeptide phosphotransferase/UDP-N-acetylglucosamine-1-phosphate transferase